MIPLRDRLKGRSPLKLPSPSPLKERDKKESQREAKPLLNKPSPFPLKGKGDKGGWG